MKILQKSGFFIIKNLIPLELIAKSLNDIISIISKLSQELGISTADYLSCTGRWGTSSQVTKIVSQVLDEIIKSYLEKSLQCQILKKKSNVICKTADLIDAVPFHQDISYSFNDPYHFSIWLALNNVSETSGALQIIENSHKWEIKPLVDFWYPYFFDQYSDNRENYKIKSLPISAGDAIVFDSRLWHGSDKNIDAKDRFAYVTRWIIKDQNLPCVPKPQHSIFGILNCGELTESMLRECLSLFGYNKGIKAENTKELIKNWLAFLTDATISIPEINTAEAKRDLCKLLILNQASTLHDAGDISGKIYKNLWFSLLVFLNKKVNIVELEL
ncbi:phytanoyl-CoA dioxygenase family protein [Wolbachia endosymbiont of Pentalonia nigronervosa]|uniref:phytanoyl-CoA dioxygenase family protein n=1 Tax=Wolbachia endosymbiont of Pentalonia nigronervosa TaxID=1301914 RepID=UPI00165EBE76|nr:phytanoyl-CoA dioxygenase family protein [Wolbachia endosymbiont of Pentalonia nigronervosa]MBD0391810.1 phytanoyl-CoA dioxygenase family protein [Wolbachia endosymbiont of Pentalonia nigronervosa]